MTFVLEAIRTVRGSALVLHYGSSKDTDAHILIDCGSDGSYENYLRPRLLQLARNQPLPVHLVMASKTDPGHLSALKRMFFDIKGGHTPIKPEQLWLSIPDDGTSGAEENPIPELLELANHLGFEINGAFKGAGLHADTTAHPQGHGLSLEVLAPHAPRTSHGTAAPIVLARKGDQSILLPGNAPAIRITEALTNAGYLDTSEAKHMEDPFHVNLMAITQENPDIDLSAVFFRSVTADSYLFTGNGQDRNPNARTLREIGAARGNDDFNVYFTLTQTPDNGAPPVRQEIDDWIANEMPDGCVAHFREDSATAMSTRVELPA
jgi:hypothetical protein